MVSEAAIKKHHLDESFNKSCHKSLVNADLIAVLHDVSNSWTRNVLDPTVLETLQLNENIPSVLVLNKIDELRSKRILLDLGRLLTENTLQVQDRRFQVWRGAKTASKFEKEMNRPVKYKSEQSRGWPNFSDIFMVSALYGDGLQAVMVWMWWRTR